MEKISKNGINGRNGERGFTLVEVMVAMFIGLIIATMLFYTLEQQSRRHTAETEISEIQTKTIAITEMIGRDIRLAGYYARGNAVLEASSTSFTFRADVSHDVASSTFVQGVDSDITPNIETLTYYFKPPTTAWTDTSVPAWNKLKHNGEIHRVEGTIDRLFVDNVDDLSFEYYDGSDRKIDYEKLATYNSDGTVNTESKKYINEIRRIRINVVDSTASAAASEGAMPTNPADIKVRSRKVVLDIAPPNLGIRPDCGLVTTDPSGFLEACDPPGSVAHYTFRTYDAAGSMTAAGSVTIQTDPGSSIFQDAALTRPALSLDGIYSVKNRARTGTTLYVKSFTNVKDSKLSIIATWQREISCPYTTVYSIWNGKACNVTNVPAANEVYACIDKDNKEGKCQDRTQTVLFHVTDNCGNPAQVNAPGDTFYEVEFWIKGNDSSGSLGYLYEPPDTTNIWTTADGIDLPRLRTDENGDVTIGYRAPDKATLQYGGNLPIDIGARIYDLSSDCHTGGEDSGRVILKPCTPKRFVFTDKDIYQCMNSRAPLSVNVVDACDNLIAGVPNITAVMTSTRVSNETLSEISGANPSPTGPVAVREMSPGFYQLRYNTRTDLAEREPRPDPFIRVLYSQPDINVEASTEERTHSYPSLPCACNIVGDYFPEKFCALGTDGGISLACPDRAQFTAYGGAQGTEPSVGRIVATSPGTVNLLVGDINNPTQYFPETPKIPFTATPLKYQWPFWLNNGSVPIQGNINLRLEEYSLDNRLLCTFESNTKVLCSQSELNFIKKVTLDGKDLYYPAITYDPYAESERIYVELKDCNRLKQGPIPVEVWADSGDRETLNLVNPSGVSDETYYRSKTSDPTEGLPITALYLPIQYNGRLEVNVNDEVHVQYKDPTPNCGCEDISYDDIKLTSFCIAAALYSGGAGAFGGTTFRIHWGEAVVYEDVDFSGQLDKKVPFKDRTMPVIDTTQRYGAGDWRDRWVDVYVGGTIVGGTSTTDIQPFYNAARSYSNIYQRVPTEVLGCIMAKLDYDQVKAFSKKNDVYYYAKDDSNVIWLKSDGKQQEYSLCDAIKNNLPRFMFIDLKNAPNLTDVTGVRIDAGIFDTDFPRFDLPKSCCGNLDVCGFLYIAGHLNIPGLGNGANITVKSPPLRDKQQPIFPPNGEGGYDDLPVTYDPAASPGIEVTLEKINIDGTLYIEGLLTGNGGPAIFGSLATERGYHGQGDIEVWYNYNNARSCGQRNCCIVTIYPRNLQIPIGTCEQLTAAGGTGGQIIWSIDDNKSGGSIDRDSGYYCPGLVMGAEDIIKAVDVGGCQTGYMTATVVCPTLKIEGWSQRYLGDPANPTVTYTITGGKSPYVWSVSDASIATIDQNGVLTPVAQGTVAITVTDQDGCKGTKYVSIIGSLDCESNILIYDDFDGDQEGGAWSGQWQSCTQISPVDTNHCVGMDDWKKGTPAGKCSDPSFDHTKGAGGSGNAWGNDLGIESWDGCYPIPDKNKVVKNYLRSPLINATGYQDLQIHYWRDLNISNSKDVAKIFISCGATTWQQAWTSSGTFHDGGWATADITLPAAVNTACNNQSEVYVYFYLDVDKNGGGGGGWNIDEFWMCGVPIPPTP